MAVEVRLRRDGDPSVLVDELMVTLAPNLSDFDMGNLYVPYNINGLVTGKQYRVLAIGYHVYEDRSRVLVMHLDTLEGIKEVAADRLAVAHGKES